MLDIASGAGNMPRPKKGSHSVKKTVVLSTDSAILKEQVKALFEEAKQKVRPTVKLEREAERIDQELLNFRMRRRNEP